MNTTNTTPAVEATGKNTKKTSVYTLCATALMTAILCVLAPITIPIGPVPISLSMLVLVISIYLLGTKWAMISCIVYLVIGMIGLPVFSGFSGGFAKLAGPTGGYLIGYLFLILIGGLFISFSEKRFEKKKSIPLAFVGLVIGTLVLYAFGTVWFMILMDADLAYALTVCVLPFIPFDIVKLILGIILGRTIRARLSRASLNTH